MDGGTATVSAESVVEPKRRSSFTELFIRLVKEKPLGTVGLVIVLLLFFTGIFADILAPYEMNQINLLDALQPPSAKHLIGTDNLGRDVLSNIIFGARISMIIGLWATFTTTVVSTIIGGLSGLIGGKFDLAMQRFVDAWLCIPGMLILLIMMSIIGKGIPQMVLAISVPMGIGGSRMIRSAVFAIRENVYVEAGRVLGASTWRMFMRHIVPNIMPVIIIGFSMQIGGVILMEASLSFLGYGVPPGVPSWGSMLAAEGREYMELAPPLALWPGLALSLVVYGTNMFGDAMRDLLDPKLKGGLGRYGGPKKKIKIKTRM